MSSSISFNPQSDGYKALLCAYKGDIDNLKALPKKVWGELTVASDAPVKRFTPLHYAMGGGKWAMVAFLINESCKPDILSTAGTTVINLFAKNPLSLCNMLNAWVDNKPEERDLDAFVKVITNSELLQQRQAVLGDKELCVKIGSALPKQEALLIITALMVGSFVWKGNDTDFAHHVTSGSPLKLNGTINCSQMLCTASILGGMPICELDEYIASKAAKFRDDEKEKRKLLKEQHKLLIEDKLTVKEFVALTKETNHEYSQNMGLPQEGRILWNPKKKPNEPIRVFYCEVNGMIMHYGLLYSGNGKPLAIHLYPENPSSQSVVCEEALPVFAKMKKVGEKIYLSMLPWIEKH